MARESAPPRARRLTPWRGTARRPVDRLAAELADALVVHVSARSAAREARRIIGTMSEAEVRLLRALTPPAERRALIAAWRAGTRGRDGFV